MAIDLVWSATTEQVKRRRCAYWLGFTSLDAERFKSTAVSLPLFDITLGMDAESNGYDNIYLRGLFLGLTRQQIDAKMDDIAAFSELGEFLSLPIRTYSAGMRMRLAFSISTSIKPDIPLLDEGIGAGDAAFIGKAEARLAAFTARAGIIVLASHSDGLIRKVFRTALLMEHGRIVMHGGVDQVLDTYPKRLATAA